jgi:hypothetical protein
VGILLRRVGVWVAEQLADDVQTLPLIHEMTRERLAKSWILTVGFHFVSILAFAHQLSRFSESSSAQCWHSWTTHGGAG